MIFNKKYKKYQAIALPVLIHTVLGINTAYSSDDLKFTDIAENDNAGISYRRTVSTNNAILDGLKQQSSVNFGNPAVLANTPIKPGGAPGVAILDFDNDGDLDIYVTNGPGSANSLYSSQLKQTGEMNFIDVAVQAGVTATDQDSSGVCFGDIDNDGDQDLVVLGNHGSSNKLFENQGNSSFIEVAGGSAIESPQNTPSSCALGDIDNDGLLDLVIGNTYTNWNHRLPSLSFQADHLLQANQLFLNTGNGFTDVSTQSGIGNISRITWAVSLVDYDQDGDLDLITADDQGPKPAQKFGGRDDGYVRIFQNDGTGVFTDVTEMSGTNRFGAWMGLAFGDLNNDGNMDIFATNSGDYFHLSLAAILPYPATVKDFSTGWFLGDENGQFSFPGTGSLIATPFGWGAAMPDYDNDGDADIIFYGGANMGGFADASNPGSILINDGQANFQLNTQADLHSVQHSRRDVQGMAVGDLNDDGFVDIVSVSNENWPDEFPLIPYLPQNQMFGSPFDATAYRWPIFMPIDQFGNFAWTGMEPVNGTLSIEISSGHEDNHWLKVKAKGSVGLTENAVVNHDGIGAVIKFTPKHGKTAMHPVLGGSSYASQNSLEWGFGLGEEEKGMLEILWPGGVRNKLYNVKSGETVIFPELPCSYDDQSITFKQYKHCVENSLDDLLEHNLIQNKEAQRLMWSAIKAFNEAKE